MRGAGPALTSGPPAAIGLALGGTYVDPAPIVPHTVSTDALEGTSLGPQASTPVRETQQARHGCKAVGLVSADTACGVRAVPCGALGGERGTDRQTVRETKES